ncbi:hypothetical protein DB346_08480 [Verrucomicrobia bacterium LW23]|nr:hypothetical protein DB346_08480 [Verrucomicrobia bacterium LW23]
MNTTFNLCDDSGNVVTVNAASHEAAARQYRFNGGVAVWKEGERSLRFEVRNGEIARRLQEDEA